MLGIQLDYSKTETIKCQLESVFDYLQNFNDSLVTATLETLLFENFNKENYDNDLAFDCFSVGLDFDFAGNENVKGIESTYSDTNILKIKKDAYQKNYELFEKEVDRML